MLPANIPHCHLQFFVLDGLDIEANCRKSIGILPKFELVYDGRFARSVKPEHQDALLLVEGVEEAVNFADENPIVW